MAENEATDEKYLRFVKDYLDFPILRIRDIHLKVFSRLGDSVAVFLLRALYPSMSSDGLTLDKILEAISAAFEYKSAIDDASNRIPAVSLCLLEVLLARPYSAEQKNSIRTLIEYLKKDTIGV